MIILDTNVLSAMMKAKADERVVTWLDKQARTSMWTTSVTIFEVLFGLQIVPAGKRRSLLTRTFETVLRDDIGGRVAPFDSAAAQYSANLMALRHKRGRPVELRDTMIAGIALACHATIATRNVQHFADLSIPIVDPWAR